MSEKGHPPKQSWWPLSSSRVRKPGWTLVFFAAAATAVSLLIIVIFKNTATRTFICGNDKGTNSDVAYASDKQFQNDYERQLSKPITDDVATYGPVFGDLNSAFARLKQLGMMQTQPFQPATLTAVGGRDGLVSLPVAMVQQSKGSHALCLAAMGLHLQALDSFLATPGVKTSYF
jgi:hypothetical protein